MVAEGIRDREILGNILGYKGKMAQSPVPDEVNG